MTAEPVTLEALTLVPEKMIQGLKDNFNQQDYDFLVSFKKGDPDWSIACSDQIQYLPAVQWKLLNIRKMPKQKQIDSVSSLQKTMEQWLK
jgi:hypothetical protein